MALESRIETGGRRVLRSPLWVGLLITAFLVIPTFLVPTIPLWVALVSLITLTPLVLGSTYLLYYLYERFFGTDGVDSWTTDERETETPIDQLRYEYATGEIDEETFDRKLERLLETETLQQRTRSDDGTRETDLLRE